MSDPYITRAVLFKLGGRPEELSTPGRDCASVSADTDIFELDNHGFADDDLLLHRAESGGTLPAPLEAGVAVYAIPLTDSTYKVAATAGGAAINLSEDGASVVVVRQLPIDDVIEAYSRFVDPFIPAHLVPLTEPIPVDVQRIVAELSFAKLLRLNGQTSISMKDAELAAVKQLERWASGVPLRDANATGPANLAIAETVTRDPRGWGGGSCLL